MALQDLADFDNQRLHAAPPAEFEAANRFTPSHNTPQRLQVPGEFAESALPYCPSTDRLRFDSEVVH